MFYCVIDAFFAGNAAIAVVVAFVTVGGGFGRDVVVCMLCSHCFICSFFIVSEIPDLSNCVLHLISFVGQIDKDGCRPT